MLDLECLYGRKKLHHNSLWLAASAADQSHPTNLCKRQSSLPSDLYRWVADKHAAVFWVRLFSRWPVGQAIRIPRSVSAWLPNQNSIWSVPSRCATTGLECSSPSHCRWPHCVFVLLDRTSCFCVDVWRLVLTFCALVLCDCHSIWLAQHGIWGNLSFMMLFAAVLEKTVLSGIWSQPTSILENLRGRV